MTPEQKARLAILRGHLDKAETSLREGRPNLALLHVASALAHLAKIESAEGSK
jgi:hypothetical protein